MFGMDKWKVWTSLLVCLWGLIYAAPNLVPTETAETIPQWLPHKQVSLGLDLRGGSYLLLEVDVAQVMRERLTNLLDAVRTTARTQRLNISNLAISGTDAVTFRVRDQPEIEKARQAVATLDPAAKVSTTPEGQITLTFDPKDINDLNRKALTQSVEIVRRRIDESGTREPVIQAQGQDRILVQLPGLRDPARIKELLGKTAKLTFHLVDLNTSQADIQANRPPEGVMIVPGDRPDASGRAPLYAVQRRVGVAGDRLTDAQPGTNPQTGEWVVNFKFDSAGARQFGDITKANVNKPFAVVLDGKVITAPNIREPILGGSGQISGSFNAQSASDLAVLLRAGALPAPLKIIEERSVGPDLGADSIRAGVYATIAGFILVVAYMIAAYGLFGLFANIALFFNLAVTIAFMSLLQATLTLPGIAGLLLMLGMSVDANVLINERIREETRNGKTPLAAIDAGFSRALSTIVDANLTTLIKMLILYALGSGAVKGFAVTISIGILTSMFTATLLVRLMIMMWMQYRRPKALPA